jgi:RNA polymerase sigma-70 factor, ECF subfamily
MVLAYSVREDSVQFIWDEQNPGVGNIKIVIMAYRSDSSLALPAVAAAAADRTSSTPSRLEVEVTELFDQLRNPLFRYVLTIGLGAADGEEVIQEVFLALFRHLRSGKPRDNLRGWLFRVAHNLALKQRQKSRTNRWMEPQDGAEDRQIARGPNPEEALADRQRQRGLLAVVEALPEKERYCLHLRAEGLRYREIAEVLGISLGGVSISLTRALARLRRADGAL